MVRDFKVQCMGSKLNKFREKGKIRVCVSSIKFQAGQSLQSLELYIIIYLFEKVNTIVNIRLL